MIVDVLDRYRRDREFEIAEVGERQRERLLDVLGRQSTHAAAAAESASHIAAATHDIASASRDIAVQVSRMAAVADWALSAIVEHLALVAEHLGGVEEMLANPRETAAAEYYRNGTYALASGWWEDAVNDLSKAVTLYRYNPRTWFNLGVAQHRHDSADDAAEAFGRCALYGVPVDSALAARAVLISACLHRTARRPDKSTQILQTYAEKIDNCAEIHLALGVHHNQHDHLVEALTLAPDLVVDARIGKAPSLEAAATVVCQLSTGPVHRLRTVEQLIDSVAGGAREAGLENVQAPPAPVDLPPDGVEALLLAHDALQDVVKAIARMAAEVQDEYRQRQAAADSAAKGMDAARTEVLRAEQKAQQMESLTRDLAQEFTTCSETRQVAVGRVEQGRQAAREAFEQAPERAQGYVTGYEAEIAELKVIVQVYEHEPNEDAVLQIAKSRLREAKARAEQAVAEAERQIMEEVRQAERQAEEEAVLLRVAVGQEDALWKQVGDANLRGNGEAQRRSQECRQRYEADQRGPDDRHLALEGDIRALLVEPARQSLRLAQDQVQAAARVAEAASAVATAAAVVVATAHTSMQSAILIAASPKCVIPFDLPSQWNDLDG